MDESMGYINSRINILGKLKSMFKTNHLAWRKTKVRNFTPLLAHDFNRGLNIKT